MEDLSPQEIQKYFGTGHTGFWKQEYAQGKHPKLFADKQMEELLGITENLTPEYRFDFFLSHIYEEDKIYLQSFVDEMKHHEAEIFYRYVHPQRGILYIRCTGKPVFADDGVITLVGYHHELADVMRFEPDKILENRLTQQKRDLVDNRMKTAEYYKDLLDMASCGILSYTMPDYQILHMNAEAMRIFGTENLADAQKRFAKVIAKTSYKGQDTLDKLTQLRTGNGKVDYECTMQNEQGLITHAIAKTETFQTPEGKHSVVTTLLDISENFILRNEMQKAKDYREKLENAYHELMERESILTTLCSEYDVVYFCDLEKDYLRVIKDSNPKAPVGAEAKFSTVVSMFKNLKNLTESAAEYVKKLDRKYLMKYLKEHSELSLQFYYQRKDGAKTYMETRIIHVQMESGCKIVLGSRNIDEIVREREEKNQLLHEAMLEAERANTVKTEFLQRMSHDIRTPINGIFGMINIAEHYDDDLNKQIECRDKIKDSASLLLELVNEVLDMNKLDSGKVNLEQVPFNLYDTAEETFEVIKRQAEERGITVKCRGKGVVHGNVIGSPLHIKRILMNVMSNAVKYNKDYGSIDLICTEISTKDPNISQVQFVCHDTGIGMSREFQKHLFEPFALEPMALEKMQYSRTGLGLSIVKRLVDAMDGSIQVESVKGEGTTVTVTIPFRIADSQIRIKEPVEEPEQSICGMNILLVEDNELNMEISEFMLLDKGANVIKAWNGQEAVRLFEDSEPGSIDTILMDVMMPVMDGYAATQRIRASSHADAKQIPIIAMTANAFTEDKIKAQEMGMNDHIGKPIDVHKLIQLLANYQNKAYEL